MYGSGAPYAYHTYGPAGLVSSNFAGTTTFFAFDPQGNVSERMNSAGTATSWDTYDGFGDYSTTDTQYHNQAYGAEWGYFFDSETGYLLLGHRYRPDNDWFFLTRDPIGTAGGINLYEYVGNDPVNEIDPSGLARRRGKTPPSSWPAPPANLLGKGAKWNPNGYWEGGRGGYDIVWDPSGHGGGGHWDEDQCPGNKRGGGRRWDANGNPLPFAVIPPKLHSRGYLDDKPIQSDGAFTAVMLGAVVIVVVGPEEIATIVWNGAKNMLSHPSSPTGKLVPAH